MYVLDRALLEIDIWVKNEGDKSNDEKLLSVYVEICVRSCFDKGLTGRIQNDHCMLDMDYMFLAGSVEAVIQVFTTLDNPHHVRFTAFSRYFDREVVLFEGKCVEKGELFKHVIVLKAKEKVTVRSELDNTLFEWTFQDGVIGASSYPDFDSIFNQFHVRVFFAPKNQGHRRSRYHDWEERCRNKADVGLLN